MSWAYAFALHTGEDHDECDDVCVCETLGDYVIAAVSDGAGSAEFAREGASIACQCFVELGVQIFSESLEPSCLLAAIRERLPEGLSDSYSCTFVGVVAGPKGALFMQVGDGAGVIRSFPDRDYEVAVWPEETEFLNHTFFITAKDAAAHLQIRRFTEPIFEFALFTDGLQHLILDNKSRMPHQPFFHSIFKNLLAESSHDRKTSWWLERLLASEQVTKRTDDDTSVVIARRVAC